MIVFCNPDVTCPFKTALHTPMEIWGVEFEPNGGELPTVRVYLTCKCCEDVLMVEPIKQSFRDELWVTKDLVTQNTPSLTMREVRKMPPR